MTSPAPSPEPSAELDDALFQAQVEKELEPLYMQETSPVAAMRMRSRSSSSLAWLGPMALVGLAFIFVFVVLPYLNQVLTQTWGIVLIVVIVPLLLIGLSNKLGRRRKEQAAALREQQQHVVAELRQLEPEAQEWVLLEQRLDQQHNLSVDEQAHLLESWEQSGKYAADKLLARPEVREMLCPALREAPKDVFGLSKVTTPVLLEHLAEGRLHIPRVPVLFAAVALNIHREGVDRFCASGAAAEAAPAADDAASEH
jgi:Sec-independent protein translocase protein TatA